MSIVVALLLMAAGAGLHALHTWDSRKREQAAYHNGFAQARKEMEMRQEAVAQYAAQLRQPVPMEPEGLGAAEAPRQLAAVDDTFMARVRQSGRAVMRMQ